MRFVCSGRRNGGAGEASSSSYKSIQMSEWTEMEKMQAECVKPSQSVVEQGKSECCSMSSEIRQSNTD